MDTIVAKNQWGQEINVHPEKVCYFYGDDNSTTLIFDNGLKVTLDIAKWEYCKLIGEI